MLKQAFSVFLLLAFLSCSRGSYSDYVLCLDSDGRMELEASHDGYCGSKTHDIHKNNHSPASQSDCKEDCGPCVDIPFIVDAFLQSLSSSKSKIFSDANALIVDRVALKWLFSRFFKKCFFPCYFEDPLQITLQTTVLRI